MKAKVLLLAVIALMCILLVACGEAAPKNENNDTAEKTEAVDKQSETENPNKVDDGKKETEPEKDEGIVPVKVNLNKEFENDFMKVTFTSMYTAYDLLPTDTSSYYSYYEGTEGSHFFVLEGTFKNVGTFAEGPDNSVAKIVFDDKYEYKAEIYNEQDNRLNSIYAVDPFQSVRLVIAASVPDELLNQYSTVYFLCGLTDSFSYGADSKYTYVYDWDDVTMIYELDGVR